MIDPVMLAQATPAIPMTGWVEYLLSQGVLGIVVLGLAWFLIKKDNRVSEINDQRLKDMREMSEVIKKQTVAMEESARVDDQIRQSLESYARLVDKQVFVLDGLVKTVNDLCGRRK